MSVSLDRIYKNDALRAHFEAVISAGNLPHAMILEGRTGSGRQTLAYEIAMALCCKGEKRPCRKCDRCRKISTGIDPDIFTVGLLEGKATFSVEQVRELKAMSFTFPTEGDYKVFIIRDSEKMTVQAQNAFLKILEEPPSFVVFILLCTNASLLLPTVVSRAPVFRMQKLSYEEICGYLADNDKAKRLERDDPDSFSFLIRCANGSIGSVLERLDKRSMTKSNKHYEQLTALFDNMSGVDKAGFIGMEDELNIKKREELNALASDIRLALRDILSFKSTGKTDTLFFTSLEKPKEYATLFTLGAVVEMIGCCDKAMKRNEQNANLNLLKINFMSDLWRAAHL